MLAEIILSDRFIQGGDYQKHKYKDSDIVVDNPPFSITSQILDYYLNNNIKFFLFCDGKTMPCRLANKRKLCIICTDAQIVYENGAQVYTGFVTNLEDEIGIKITNRVLGHNEKEDSHNYINPYQYITFKEISALNRINTEMEIEHKNFKYVKGLKNGTGTYGGGVIVSDKIATKIHDIIENSKQNKKIIVKFDDDEIKILNKLNEGSD